MRLGIGARIVGGLALAAGVGGAVFAYRHLTGDAYDQQGGDSDSRMGRLKFIARNFMHPLRLLTINSAADDARQAELELYRASNGGKPGSGNGADAFRHTYAMALATARLVIDRGMSPQEAGEMAWQAGIANETGSENAEPGTRRYWSRQMDLHNNQLGIDLGRQLAVQSARGMSLSDQAVRDAVLGAIGGGRALVLRMRNQPPMATGKVDLPF